MTLGVNVLMAKVSRPNTPRRLIAKMGIHSMKPILTSFLGVVVLVVAVVVKQSNDLIIESIHDDGYLRKIWSMKCSDS